MYKRYLYLGFFPIPALIVIIVALYFAVKPSAFYDPALLIPFANTLFVAVICFTLANTVMRNCKTTSLIQILLLDSGVLISGTEDTTADFVKDREKQLTAKEQYSGLRVLVDSTFWITLPTEDPCDKGHRRYQPRAAHATH
jgi:hypothetical protein